MQFLDEPPTGDSLTSYDEQHLVIYLRLLDADAEGADWREAALILFGIDSDADADRARLVYSAHLARAEWMRDSGFRRLLENPSQLTKR